MVGNEYRNFETHWGYLVSSKVNLFYYSFYFVLFYIYYLHLNIVFFFTEPWIRRSSRTSGKLENSISYGSHDGARPSNHHARQTGCLRFHTEHHVGAQIFHALQVVRRAAFQAGALRFRAA